MVCGVDLYTDADHPCDPHEQDSLHRKLGEQVINNNISSYRGYCGLVDHIAACEDFGIRSFARAVLAFAGGDADRLCGSHSNGQGLVRSAVWGIGGEFI